MTIAEYWKELNEMYGTDIKMPSKLAGSMKDVAYDMAMGESFDSAMQNGMEE